MSLLIRGAETRGDRAGARQRHNTTGPPLQNRRSREASADGASHLERRRYHYGMGHVLLLVYNNVELCYNDAWMGCVSPSHPVPRGVPRDE
jgi:hypothetical protein